MRGAELGSGIFRLSDITLTNLAQIVSNDLFRKHCPVKVCDFSEVPAVLYRWNCGWVCIPVIRNDDLLLWMTHCTDYWLPPEIPYCPSPCNLFSASGRG